MNLLRSDGTYIESKYSINNNENLGIVLSGIGYTLRNPLLYYSMHLLRENNIDYFGVNFGYRDNVNYNKLDNESRNNYFNEDNKIIHDKILELSKNYKKLIFIGKSLGIGTIRHCIKNEVIKSKSKMVLLTPPGEVWENFIDEIIKSNIKTLVIGSLLDKLYNVKNLSQIYGKDNIETYELKNGDHSLEINNTVEDIKQLGKIIQKINKFIEKVNYEEI